MLTDPTELSETSVIGSESTTELFLRAYDELRRIAGGMMLRERRDHTLSATALVNEAFIRFIGSESLPHEGDQHRFRRMAIRSMRNVLIDHARRKQAVKRRVDRQDVPLETIGFPGSGYDHTLKEFDDSVDLLEREDPQAAEFARLRVYAGQSVLGAGRELGLSRWDSYQTWEFIEAWFRANAAPIEA